MSDRATGAVRSGGGADARARRLAAAAALGRAAAVVVLDISAVVGGAALLWNSGGTTVVDGSWLHRVGCVASVALLLLARSVVLGRSIDEVTRRRIEAASVVIEAAALAAAIAVWLMSGIYVVGWAATFGAMLLMLGSLWQLLALLLARSHSPFRSLRSIRALATGVGLVALVVLTPVHGAHASILGGLIVLLSGAVVLSFAAGTWLAAIGRQR